MVGRFFFLWGLSLAASPPPRHGPGAIRPLSRAVDLSNLPDLASQSGVPGERSGLAAPRAAIQGSLHRSKQDQASSRSCCRGGATAAAEAGASSESCHRASGEDCGTRVKPLPVARAHAGSEFAASKCARSALALEVDPPWTVTLETPTTTEDGERTSEPPDRRHFFRLRWVGRFFFLWGLSLAASPPPRHGPGAIRPLSRAVDLSNLPT